MNVGNRIRIKPEEIDALVDAGTNSLSWALRHDWADFNQRVLLEKVVNQGLPVVFTNAMVKTNNVEDAPKEGAQAADEVKIFHWDWLKQHCGDVVLSSNSVFDSETLEGTEGWTLTQFLDYVFRCVRSMAQRDVLLSFLFFSVRLRLLFVSRLISARRTPKRESYLVEISVVLQRGTKFCPGNSKTWKKPIS